MKSSLLMPLLLFYKSKILLLIAVCILGTIPSSAQELVDVIYLSTKDGLKERQVNHVMRGANGYFYFFTDNYIQRYDGQQFMNVNTSVLADHKLRLEDLNSVHLYGDYIVLHQNISNETIGIKSSELIVKTIDPSLLPEPQYTVNKSHQGLSVTVNKNEYLWNDKFVFKKVHNKFEILDTLPHYNSKPYKLRVDKKGNCLIYYTNRNLFVDHLYILDTNEKLHDFSKLAKEYETTIDVHTDNVFHKWMVVGHNAVKIFSLKREGIDLTGMIPNLPKDQFGKLIRGIAPIDHTAYYCTENPGIYKYNNITKEDEQAFSHSTFDADGFRIMKYDSYTDHIYLIGAQAEKPELLKLSTATEQITAFPVVHKFFDFIFLNASEILIVGQEKHSLKGLLFKLNTVTGEIKILLDKLPFVSTVHYDSHQKEYWLGSSEGLYLLDENFKIKQEKIRLNKNSQIARNDELSMIVPYADKLMICSKGSGIIIFDRATKKITSNLTEKSGLSNNVITAGVKDDLGHFWASTYNGLNIIDSNFQIIKTIYQPDGLPNQEFNTRAVAKDDNGRLYFGSINGLCIIDPSKVLKWDESYRLSIEKIISRSDSRMTEIQLGENIFSGTDSLVIDYNNTDYYKYPNTKPFTHFSSPQATIHRDEGKVILTDIPSHSVQLNVYSGSSTRQKELTFNVQLDYSKFLKAFLLTLATIVLSTLIALIVIKRNTRKTEERSKLNKKISELQLAGLQGQMNPHFIFNALGAIQYFIQTNDVAKADRYLSEFARLMRGILDSSSRKYISLEDELKLLKLYAGLEKLRFENKFDVIFSVAESVDTEILIPPMIIQPYIENAVNHGLHHLVDRKGLLEINIDTLEESKLQIVIRDNGIGRKASQENKGDKNHQSKGMGITAERIRTINESSDLEISIAVNDLFHDYRPAGTQITVTMNN